MRNSNTFSYKLISQLAAIVIFGLYSSIQANATNYNTKKAFIEVHDPHAQRNPIKSIRADSWKVVEVRNKIKPRLGQAIAVVCEGNFPFGIIADDLFHLNGKLNRNFNATTSTTALEICNQQEDVMRIQNPRLFK